MKNLTAATAGLAAMVAMIAGSAHAEKLTIALESEPTSIDPHFHNLGPNNAMARQSSFRPADPAERAPAALSPGLAVSWEAHRRTDLGVQAARGRHLP